MAMGLLAGAVSDLCIGKPALPSLPASASLLDALPARKSSPSVSLAVWSCSTDDHHHRYSSSSSPPQPLHAVLPAADRSLRRVDSLAPGESLMEALDLLAPAGGSRPARGRLGKLCMSGILQLFDETAPAPDSPHLPLPPLRRAFLCRHHRLYHLGKTNSTARCGSEAGSCTARRLGRTSVAIVCRKGSSLVAVMEQALAHRVGHVWVVDDDNASPASSPSPTFSASFATIFVC